MENRFRWQYSNTFDVAIVDYHYQNVKTMIAQNRVITHPGMILLIEYLEPMELTQKKLADHLGIPSQRINEIVRGKRGISSDTACCCQRLSTPLLNSG